jgi:hypothetical protein
MTDATLHGNHEPCEACELRRSSQDRTSIDRDEIPCNACGGKGFVPLPDEEIVRRTVEEARLHYWPTFAERLQERRQRPTRRKRP